MEIDRQCLLAMVEASYGTCSVFNKVLLAAVAKSIDQVQVTASAA